MPERQMFWRNRGNVEKFEMNPMEQKLIWKLQDKEQEAADASVSRS